MAPGYGNGGYDVTHYGITVRYGTATRYLVGRTVISARVTENLSRFNLDFVLPVRSVTGGRIDISTEGRSNLVR